MKVAVSMPTEIPSAQRREIFLKSIREPESTTKARTPQPRAASIELESER